MSNNSSGYFSLDTTGRDHGPAEHEGILDEDVEARILHEVFQELQDMVSCVPNDNHRYRCQLLIVTCGHQGSNNVCNVYSVVSQGHQSLN